MNSDFQARSATYRATVERCLAELRRGGAIGLTGRGFAGQALERLEQDPGNQLRQGALQDALSEAVEADPSFAASLSSVLADIRRTAGSTLTRIDESGATSIHGDVSLQGRNVAGRDLHIGDQHLSGEEA